jgi:PAS domain-containing protein
MNGDESHPTRFSDIPLPTEDAIRLSEARFRALAESASDAIATIDAKSKILFVNRAAERIFGFSSEEMLKA